jgi:proton glutamate symport protein
MKKFALHWQIFIAIIIGILFGLFFPEHTVYVNWMGDIFLRALKMIIIPLILTSIISGVTNIGDAESLGRLGYKTIIYYLTTSFFAIVTGLVLVNLVKPGLGAELGFQQKVEGVNAASGSLWDIIIRIVPTNIFNAFATADMLGIIFFAILSGFFITRLPDHYKGQLISLANAGFALMMKITSFIIIFTPLGVLGIVSGVVAEQAEDTAALIETSKRMGWYMLTVIGGLFIHGLITLPLLLIIFGKINPFNHIKALSPALLTAFSTSSSSATLPLTIKSVEDRAGVSNKVSSFVLPMGATINMDGTALYECVAAMFIAQAYGIEMSATQQLVIVVTALLASIGAAGIPMAGLVMMTVILTAVGLPLEGIGLILAVDRILDMFRTTVNVWSDSCGAAIIAVKEGETLKYQFTENR